MKTIDFDASLIDAMFDINEELHESVEINGYKITLDLEKTSDNEINIKVTRSNSDKKEFEEWANKLDDSLFSEVWESLSQDFHLKNLNDIYESDNYPEVIKLFKERTKEIAQSKIKELQSLLS